MMCGLLFTDDKNGETFYSKVIANIPKGGGSVTLTKEEVTRNRKGTELMDQWSNTVHC